jgi:hypothetical protein
VRYRMSHCDSVYELTAGLPVVIQRLKGVELAKVIKNVGLAFLDSGGDRVEEALALQMVSGGIVVLHDAHRGTFQTISEKTGWQRVKFNTPRGLGLYQAH